MYRFDFQILHNDIDNWRNMFYWSNAAIANYKNALHLYSNKWHQYIPKLSFHMGWYLFRWLVNRRIWASFGIRPWWLIERMNRNRISTAINIPYWHYWKYYDFCPTSGFWLGVANSFVSSNIASSVKQIVLHH